MHRQVAQRGKIPLSDVCQLAALTQDRSQFLRAHQRMNRFISLKLYAQTGPNQRANHRNIHSNELS